MDTECELDQRCETLKHAFKIAKKKEEFDVILKTYKIKMGRNGKMVSALRMKLPLKKALIRMTFYEPNDIFDYDSYIKGLSTCVQTLR